MALRFGARFGFGRLGLWWSGELVSALSRWFLPPGFLAKPAIRRRSAVSFPTRTGAAVASATVTITNGRDEHIL